MTPAVETLVRDRIGLDPASLGAATLPRAVRRRCAASGLTTAEAYAGLLASDPGEWTALLAELVVPETWFFRGGVKLFDHLARCVRDRTGRTPVRVLSIPCSTGEEPYSLAMALDAAGVPPAAYCIDGVELAADHLQRAEAARYPTFSFREPDSDPRARYFRATDDGKWDLLPAIRERVRFRAGNLVAADFLAGEAPYDLILCRNLFIYLTAEGRARALANLDRLLAPDGRLCVTPAEADRFPAARFVPDGPTALAIFRRAGVTDTTPMPRSGVAALPHRAAPASAPRSGVVAVRARPERIPVQPPSAVIPAPARDPLETGRELADAGKLAEARALCDRAIAAAPTAELFSLLGVIHLAAGRRDDAADAFRRALYLDPDHVEALTHTIVLCEQRGDHGQAAGLRRRLARVERGAPA